MSEGVRISEKPLLTIKEAAQLFNIGESKLRELTETSNCKFVLWVGKKRLIKRQLIQDFFERSYSL